MCAPGISLNYCSSPRLSNHATLRPADDPRRPPPLRAVALIGCRMSWHELLTVSFFGIRGIGSFYYLAYALNRREFPAADGLCPP